MPNCVSLGRKASLIRTGLLTALLTAAAAPAFAAIPPACPPKPMRVVRSAGGNVDYKGTVPGVPDLCRMSRGDGDGDFYLGSWRSDWPGAGQAYPIIKAVIDGKPGVRLHFITRSVPGQQFVDTYVNEGNEVLTIDGRKFTTLKVAHEREGIEGNTYHSIITSWRDVATGAVLKTVEDQIAGQSYGPDTTWTAVKVMPLP